MTRYYFQIISPSGGVIVSVPCSHVAYFEFLDVKSYHTPWSYTLEEWARKFLSPRSFQKVSDFILSDVDSRVICKSFRKSL